MPKRMAIAVVLALSIAGLTELRGGSYVVAPNGNDTNPGSWVQPWRSLARANNSLQPGDTVYVRAGTYHERIAPTRSGRAGAPIVYLTNPGEVVTVDGEDDTNLGVVVIQQNYIVVEGFTFRNQDYFDLPGKTDYWVQLEGHHVTFRYNRVIADGDPWTNIYTRNAMSRGVVVAGQYGLIEHCFVRGQVFGIVIAGPSPRFVTIRFDTVYANGQNNIDNTATEDGTTAYHGTLIEYCVLDTSLIEDNIQFEPDYGDPTSTLHNRGTIIRYNRMGNAAENAIDLKGAGHTLIEHNLVYSSSGDDDGPIGGHDVSTGGGITSNPNNPTRNTIVRANVIWDHATGLDMAEGDHYYNNTILNNRRTWQGPNQPGGNFTALRAFNYPNAKRAFLNNIIAAQPNAGIYNWQMDYGDKFHLDNNLYYDSAAAARFYHRKNGSMITTTGLAAWKTELATYGGYSYMRGKDASSREANPLFANAPVYAVGYMPTWDFGLEAGSPAIDAGRPVAEAIGSASGSATLTVDDAMFFCDGWGITDGDLISIGGSEPVRILSINHTTNVLTLAAPRTWSTGAGVHLAYTGSAPDIGAFEFNNAAPLTDPPPATVLVDPADGTPAVPLGSRLRWADVPTARWYELQVSTSPSFSEQVIDQTNIPGTSFSIASLGFTTTYFWRVRAYNMVGAGPWSSPRQFVTSGDFGGPGKTGNNVVNNGDFENGSVGWTFYTNSTGSFSASGPAYEGSLAGKITIVQTGTNVQLYQSGIALQPSTIYRLSFVAYSNTGHDLSVGLMQHVSPYTNYGLWTRKVDLSEGWKADTIYLRTKGFTSPVTDARLQFWFPALAAAGDEYWIDDVVLEEAPPPAIPDPPHFVSPLPMARNQSVMLPIQWSASAHADAYDLELAPDSLFTRMVVDTVVTDTTATVGPLQSNTRYYRRVRAINISGDGSYCPTCYFNTEILKTDISSAEEIPEDFVLVQNYPNPFNPSTTFRYAMPFQSRVTLTVHSALGAEVAVFDQGEQSAGTHEVMFDASRLASGTYFYTLRAPGFTATRRMVLVK
jgi:hypothetical protein